MVQRCSIPLMGRADDESLRHLLQEVGELIEYEFSEGGNHHEATRLGHHAHAVCDNCGQMEDVEVAGADGSLLAAAG